MLAYLRGAHDQRGAFCLSLTGFVEADAVHASADVDGPGRDAEDAVLLLQTLLRVNAANGHRSR